MPTTAAAPLALPLLTDISCGLARAPELWGPHAHHLPGDRRPVRLLATERYEAWVIGWTPGQAVDLHDHGEAVGALTVVEGCLDELVLRVGGLRRRSLPQGITVRLPAGLVHDVVAPGDGPATSVHVYSPPLRTMTFYAPDGRPLRTAEVAPEEPVLGPNDRG